MLERFHNSLDFRQLAPTTTRRHYAHYRAAIVVYPVRNGTLGELLVDRLGPPVFRHLVDAIAVGAPARDGAGAVPGYPSKANTGCVNLRRAFGWGVEHDACKTNPCREVKCVPERCARRAAAVPVGRQEIAH